MRWTSYGGDRIAVKGHRTFVELPPLARFAEPTRIYGCVWNERGAYRGYYEVHRPGEVVDIEVGPFATEVEARAAIEVALTSAAGER